MTTKQILLLTLLLLGVSLAREAQAFYNPSTGRWLSRDLLDEEGGVSIYGFSGNDPIDLFDIFGLWIVNRNSVDPRAWVIGNCGDTVAELAKQVHLDVAEYQKWLKPLPPSVLPGSANDPLTGTEWFKIPNKAYVNDLIGIDWNIWWQPWKWAEERVLKKQGFYVVEVDNTMASAFKDQFADEDAYGIVVIEHGDPDFKGDFSDAGPGYVTPAEASTVLHHKLGGLKLIWCWSGAKATEWKASVAPGGRFYSNPRKIKLWDAQPGVIRHGF